jgi:hypothetical protein
VATFRIVINIVEQIHCSQKKAPVPIHSTPTDRCADPQPISLPSHPLKQWGKRQAFVDDWQHQLIRLISPACDQYIQYLLVGANHSVLNRYRRGLQPWRCRFSISLSPPFPTDGSPLFYKGPTRSPIKHPHVNCTSSSCINLEGKSYCSYDLTSIPINIMHNQAHYKVELQNKRQGFWWDASGLVLFRK